MHYSPLKSSRDRLTYKLKSEGNRQCGVMLTTTESEGLIQILKTVTSLCF